MSNGSRSEPAGDAGCRGSQQLKLRVLAGALWLICSGSGFGVDLHRLWDDRCLECHGHAAAFAREHLRVVDGTLQGLHPSRDLRVFLRSHFLGPQETDPVYAMLLAQAGSNPSFKERCAGCHESAAQFARKSLEFRDGVLYGRRSGQPVEAFLQQHRKLTPEDAAFFSAVLNRVAQEVGLNPE